MPQEQVPQMPPSSRFQAIVLAGGRGSRMTSLTDHVPKAFLPVANIPLFWYPLNTLARSGFTYALLVVGEDCRASVKERLADGSLPSLRNMNVQVLSVGLDSESEEDSEWGTADVLRYLLRKELALTESENLLIMGGDLVTNMCLDEMLSQHLNTGATLTSCLSPSVPNGPSPGPKERRKYRDFVALSFSDSSSTTPSQVAAPQVLYLCEEEDYGDSQSISTTLFKRFSHVNLTSSLKDVHLYAVKRARLEKLLEGDDTLSALKADVIPLLLESQYAVDCGDKCIAYCLPEGEKDAVLVAQCNTIPTYFEANKLAAQLVLGGENFGQSGMEGGKDVDFKSLGFNVADSLIGQGNEFGKKATVKKSIVGSNCRIGANARIDNSLLMDGVSVGAGAQIKNSIMCPNSELGEKMELQMCIVASGYRVVEGKKKHANEVLCEEKEVNLYE